MTRSREAANWIGTGVTSAELDKLDGFTGTVDDLNYAKDLRATGVTATEFDHLDTTSGTPGSGNFLRGDKTWTAITMPTTGISDGNTLVANANVADDDFLRVDGTSIEGRTAAETLSDIGAAPLASPTFSGTTNISSGATFPSGVIIGVENTTTNTIVTKTDTTYATVISDSITVKAGSKVLVNVSVPVSSNGDSSPAGGQILQTGTASATIMSATEIMDEHHASSGGYFGGTFMSGVLSGAGSYTFSFQGNRLSGSNSVYFVSANPGSGSASIATMTLFEIAS